MYIHMYVHILCTGTTQMEPQLCDYTGAYHCPECHHNQTHMIPARIIHNWDFTEYKVAVVYKI